MKDGGWMDVPETNGSAGDRTNAQSQFVCTEFAQRGYVAVSIDYRLASFFQILCLGLCEYFGDISPWTPWDIADYIFDHGAKSVGVGSFFVFYGKHKAVLITYPTDEIKSLINEFMSDKIA